MKKFTVNVSPRKRKPGEIHIVKYIKCKTSMQCNSLLKHYHRIHHLYHFNNKSLQWINTGHSITYFGEPNKKQRLEFIKQQQNSIQEPITTATVPPIDPISTATNAPVAPAHPTIHFLPELDKMPCNTADINTTSNTAINNNTGNDTSYIHD